MHAKAEPWVKLGKQRRFSDLAMASNASTVNSLACMPVPLVAEVAKLLSLSDSESFLLLCKDLSRIRQDVYRHQEQLQANHVKDAVLIERNIHLFVNLTHLNLGTWASQATLNCMRTSRLQSLSMAGSTLPVDILCLKDQKYLEYLDVTFCYKISYEATVQLRQFLPHLKVRRVPLEGRFEGRSQDPSRFTPYTVWSDGTIAHEHESLPVGFVDILHRDNNDPNHVYVTYEFPDSYPDLPSPLNRFFYLAGSVRVIDENSVVSAQYCYGRMFPPLNYANSKHAESLSVGEEMFFAHSGNIVERGHPDAHVMVSKVRRHPLQNDLPPPELLQRNWEHFRKKKEYLRGSLMQKSPQEAFHRLHIELGGSDKDVVNIYASS